MMLNQRLSDEDRPEPMADVLHPDDRMKVRNFRRVGEHGFGKLPSGVGLARLRAVEVVRRPLGQRRREDGPLVLLYNAVPLS